MGGRGEFFFPPSSLSLFLDPLSLFSTREKKNENARTTISSSSSDSDSCTTCFDLRMVRFIDWCVSSVSDAYCVLRFFESFSSFFFFLEKGGEREHEGSKERGREKEKVRAVSTPPRWPLSPTRFALFDAKDRQSAIGTKRASEFRAKGEANDREREECEREEKKKLETHPALAAVVVAVVGLAAALASGAAVILESLGEPVIV